MEAKGLKPPTVYDPDVVEFAKKTPGCRPRTSGASARRSTARTTATDSCRTSSGTTAGARGTRTASPPSARPSTTRTWRRSSSPSTRSRSTRSSRPGVMGWTDVSNNEAYMAGKLVTTNNGASLYYAMVAEEARAGAQDPAHPHPGRPGGQLRRRLLLQLGHLPEEQVRRALRGPDPLDGGREALRRVRQGLRRPGGARLQDARREPLLEVRPELRRHAAEHPAQRARRATRARSRRRRSRSQAQNILTDMAGRVVTARPLAGGRAEGSACPRRGDLQGPRRS